MKYDILIRFDLGKESINDVMQRRDAFHFVNRAMGRHSPKNYKGVGNSFSEGDIFRDDRDMMGQVFSLAHGFMVVKHYREAERRPWEPMDAPKKEFSGKLEVYAESVSPGSVERIEKYVTQKIKKRFPNAVRV